MIGELETKVLMVVYAAAMLVLVLDMMYWRA